MANMLTGSTCFMLILPNTRLEFPPMYFGDLPRFYKHPYIAMWWYLIGGLFCVVFYMRHVNSCMIHREFSRFLQQLGMAVCLLFCISKFMVHTVVPGDDSVSGGTNGQANKQTETAGGHSELRQLKSDPSDVHSALNCDRGTCENRCFEPYGHRDVPDNFPDADDKDVLVNTPAAFPFTPPHIVTQTKISVHNPCYCDALCVIFGDCCYDFFLLCHNTSISTLVSTISGSADVSSVLTHFVKDQSYLDLKMSMFVSKTCEICGDNWYWMISSCPHASTDHVAANKCKHVFNSSNPLSQIPASYKHFPAVVFRNVYCGLCNGIKKDKLLLWNSSAACSDSVIPAHYVDLVRKLGSGKCTMRSSPPSDPGPRKCSDFHFHKFSSRNEHSTNFLLSQLYEYWVFIGNTVYKNPHSVFHLNMVVDNMSCSPSFDYHGAEMPFCPDSSCKGFCHLSHSMDPSHCRCTIDCVLYGDCCYDFLPICLNKTMSLMSLLHNLTLLAKELKVSLMKTFKENMESKNTTDDINSVFEIYTALKIKFLQYKTCVKIHESLRMWVIGKCPRKFPDTVTVSMCEQPTSSITDSLIPVSHNVHSDITYRNIYCGLCHNQSLDELVQWRANIMCPFNKPNLELNALLLEGKCKIIFEINLPHRYCKESDEILNDSFMNKDELNDSIEMHNLTNNVSWCHLYRYEVMAGNKHFRNPHCADIKGQNVSCLPPMGEMGEMGAYSGDRSESGGLSILFNFNEHDFSFETDSGKLVSPQRSCGSDEVYDYIYSKCTKLNCLRGKIAINGRCVSNGTSFAEKIHQLLPNGFPYYFVILYINLPEETKGTDITDKFNLFIDAEEVRPFKNYLSVVDFDFINSIMNETEDFGKPFNRVIKIVLENNGSITAHLKAFSYMKELVIDHIFGNLSQRSIFFVSSYDDLFNMSCVYGAKRTTTNVTLYNTVYAKENDILYPLDKIPFTLTYQDKTPVLENIVVCDIPLSCDDPVTYNQSDFYEEGTTLKNRDRYKDMVLHNGNYFIQNTTVYSCHNFIQSYSAFFKFDIIQTILTNVMSGISITSLAITLFVYILLPELRNLPGRLTMSLSASLLSAQGLLLLIHLPTGVLCQALAIALHFLWLSTFMWMTIMFIHLANTFSGRAKPESSYTIAKTHAKCAVCAVGFPLMLVSASVVVNFMELQGLVIGYGAFGICWIANPQALLLVFGVPLAVMLLVNIISFILTFYNIEKVMRISQDISSTKKEKGKLFIYGKLFIIVGLSWSSSFVAAYADINVIWYIFIVLNNLQGFYIFVSFICTDRVYRLLKKKVRGPDSVAYTKSTIHTVTTETE